MSRQLSSASLPQSLPLPVTTSMLAAPFVHLAETSPAQIHEWVVGSALGRGVLGLYHAATHPLHEKLKDANWLHQGLKILHLLSLIGILLLATFASTDLIGLAVAGSFGILLLRAFTAPLNFKLTIIDALVLLFFLTAVVSTAFSSYVHTSIIGLVKFSVFLMGFWNFRVLIGQHPKLLTVLLAVLVLLGFGESLIGLYQYINHVQPLATWQDTSVNPEDQLTRIFGTLQPPNPNLLAGFLIPCVAAGVGLTLKNLIKGCFWMALPLSAMALTTLGALVLTGSRGGFLAIILMSVTTFLFLGHLLWNEPGLKEKYKLKALWLLVLVGSVVASAAAIALISPIRTRFLSIFAMREDSSNSYRMNVWSSTLKLIHDNWWIGIGPGNDTFKQVYGLYMIPGYNALSAYSIFLEMWAEQGILGLLLFLLLIVIIKLRAAMIFYQNLPTEHKVIVGLLLTGILGSVIYGLFDTIWYRPSVNLLFWLFVAGISVYTLSSTEEGSVNAARG